MYCQREKEKKKEKESKFKDTNNIDFEICLETIEMN